MKYRRKQQLTIILVLVAVISTISVGFAAFSSTLNISSSASVTPNSSDFKVVFSADRTSIINSSTIGQCVGAVTGVSGGASTGSSGCIGETEFKNAVANFSAPGQVSAFIFYVHNIGKYDAYLKKVNFNLLDNGKHKKCYASTSDSTKATDSLVDAACEGIEISVRGFGNTYSDTMVNISEQVIPQGTVKEVEVVITYGENSKLADGPFNVEFGNVEFEYSTVDGPKIITFQIGGTTYQGEDGMSWSEWINSSYNIGNFTDSTSFCSDQNFDAGTSQYPYDNGYFFYGNGCTTIPF